MTVVGIIAEYNPFHTGHEYHIKKIREEFGEDTVIVAVMSGSFTQRGELAIFDKTVRAKAAVKSGVDLVLELPFPFSCAGAEFFAEAGVRILDSLGAVDYVSFGSECGTLETLYACAEVLSAEKIKKSETHDARGYAEKCAELCDVVGTENSELFKSNNILAIEYIKALKKLKSKMKPHTVKRLGSSYSDECITENAYPSAMAIRKAINDGDLSALDYVPKATKDIYLSAIANQAAPTDKKRLDAAVISSLRLNSPDADIHDAKGGLYNRIRSMSFSADSISSLIELTKTKKYTTARIRRAVWYSYIGVTSSDVKRMPTYTQVLAMSSRGAALLKRIKSGAEIPILTKPSKTDTLGCDACYAKALADRADSVFQLAKPAMGSAYEWLRFTPFVEKENIPR